MAGILIGEGGAWDTGTKGKPYKDSGEDSVSKPSREAPRKNPALLKFRSHRIYFISLDQLYKTYISELLAKGVTWRYANNLG